MSNEGPDPRATRNPPVNQNVTTNSPANTAGAVNVAPAGGSGAGATGTANAPTGGSPSWESGGAGTAAPTLTTIAPTTFAKDTTSFSLVCTGTGFLPTSVAVLNGEALETSYQSATQVTGTVNSTGKAAGVVNATVNNGPTASGTRPFTWT